MKCNVEKLQIRNEKERYQATLEGKLTNVNSEDGVTEQWKGIERVVSECAKIVVGEKSKVRNEDWFDESVKCLLLYTVLYTDNTASKIIMEILT